MTPFIGCRSCRKRRENCPCPGSIRALPLVRIPRDPEQTIREHAAATIELIIMRLVFHKDELIEGAVERATTLGATEYGEAAWGKTPEQLIDELDDELKDALFYGGAREDVLRELERRAQPIDMAAQA